MAPLELVTNAEHDNTPADVGEPTRTNPKASSHSSPGLGTPTSMASCKDPIWKLHFFAMIQSDRCVLLQQSGEFCNTKILPFLVHRNQVCSALLQAEALRAQLQELAEEEQRLNEELLSAVGVVGEN